MDIIETLYKNKKPYNKLFFEFDTRSLEKKDQTQSKEQKQPRLMKKQTNNVNSGTSMSQYYDINSNI